VLKYTGVIEMADKEKVLYETRDFEMYLNRLYQERKRLGRDLTEEEKERIAKEVIEELERENSASN